MTEKTSLFAELIERRIPQILGVYVASVWLAVEVSEWMTERFDVPDQTSSYVFVIMIAFLPLVGLLAWGHGRPGKDKWTQKQIIFIPFNIAIAWFAVNTFIKPEVQATEIMSLADVQTGQMVDYEVAKSGLSQKVIGFFWENATGDESLDWLSYGAMWMVSKDLMRNPIISIRTPYESASILQDITSKGFDRAIGEPLSLNLNIADDRDSQWMIKGRILKEGDKVAFEASLYDVISGALVTTISSAYDDWLFALDDVAEQIGTVILKKANIKLDANVIPDMPISESISNNIVAIESVVKSLNAVTIDNDFELGIEYLKAALTSDENLAEAYVLMIAYYRGLGDLAAAKQAAEAALKLEYKLPQESQLRLKANYYGVSGDNDKAIKALENWVKLYPQSADALLALGSNYIIIGNRLDDALEVYKKLSEIQKSSTTALVNKARIYRLKDDKDQALTALQLYRENNQDDPEPLLEMAATHMQFGELEAAKKYYEEASLLSFNNIDADLGLAKIQGLQGLVDESLADLDGLVLKAENDSDRVKILAEKEILLFMTGRMQEAMGEVERMQEFSQSYMPPLMQVFMFDAKKASYYAYLQNYVAADEIMTQLRSVMKPPFDQILYMIERSIYELAGEDDKAAEALAKFMAFTEQFQMDVYNQFILASQAKEARIEGNYAAAIELHDQAIAESKQSFVTLTSLQILDDLLYQKALTLYQAGDFEAVNESLEMVLKRNPLNGLAMLLKSKVLIQQGKMTQAMELMIQVKQLWSGADPKYKDQEQLLEVENLLLTEA